MNAVPSSLSRTGHQRWDLPDRPSQQATGGGIDRWTYRLVLERVLLDDAVVALGPGVRDPELEEPLGLGPPPLDRAGVAGRLGHVGDGASSEEPGPAVCGLVSL